MIGVAAGPFLLAALGLSLGDTAFALPLLACAAAAVRCLTTARRATRRRGAWRLFGIAALAAALASGAGLASTIGGASPTVAYYVGFAGSLCLAAGSVRLLTCRRTPPRPEQLFDALLVAGLIAAIGLYYVAVPGFARGDVVLTASFLLDLAALVLVAASLHGGAPIRTVGFLACGLLAAGTGDGLVAAAASGVTGSAGAATALLWAAAGVGLYLGARADDGSDSAAEPAEASVRFPYLRALAPLPVVLAFPALAIMQVAREGVALGPILYFGVFFLVALVVGFGRQAYLVVADRRTAAAEREVRAAATRRNEELRALTGLAATMTESLDEKAIVERGLDALLLGARATSAALHVDRDGELELRATAGNWQGEATFVTGPGPDRPSVTGRGRRAIARFPLRARAGALGAITLLRSADDAFDDEELRLLELLVGQLGIAIQNARDYHEKVDQAIRDPLTGLYNRRFFYDALDREVERQRRYGTPVSLVSFDIDDFKWINDEHGHAAGDKVLRAIADVALRTIRPSDTIARMGGEEFALLLPETERLEALLVAERVRVGIARSAPFPGGRVRVSGGVASAPEDARTVTELEKKADDALYWAKGNGKDMCALASEVVVDGDRSEEQRSVAHLNALVVMIDGRLRTRDHSADVARYACAIGTALGLSAERLIRLRRAALLHDVGKIAVGAEILASPGRLEGEELERVREHPVIGATILGQAGLGDEATWVRHHHERVDGTGYPDGLSGEQTPLESKVLFVADAFEAMTSERPYRAKMDTSAALAELRRCAGTQFDAPVVEALASALSGAEPAGRTTA